MLAHEGAVECMMRAAEAKRRAEAMTDLAARGEFLDLAERWIRLAQSYEFVEQIDQFLTEAKWQNPNSQRPPQLEGPFCDKPRLDFCRASFRPPSRAMVPNDDTSRI